MLVCLMQRFFTQEGGREVGREGRWGWHDRGKVEPVIFCTIWGLCDNSFQDTNILQSCSAASSFKWLWCWVHGFLMCVNVHYECKYSYKNTFSCVWNTYRLMQSHMDMYHVLYPRRNGSITHTHKVIYSQRIVVCWYMCYFTFAYTKLGKVF